MYTLVISASTFLVLNASIIIVSAVPAKVEKAQAWLDDKMTAQEKLDLTEELRYKVVALFSTSSLDLSALQGVVAAQPGRRRSE